MKLVGADFLAGFGGRFLNTHPALLPGFPGMHGPADALAYGVKVTGCTLFVVDDGVDTGPIVAQAAVEVRDDDDTGLAARADQGRRAGDARRHRRPDGPRGLHHRRTGRSGSDDCSDQIPIRRALVSVYDKTGLEDLVQRPARRRRRARVDRRLGGADRGARHPGDQGRGAHRLPRVPRRPGQDPAPQGARRDPRRPPPRVARAAAGRARASSRSTWWSPTSTRSPRPSMSGASARRVRRADRHRRARRWCARRPRTTRPSRSSPRRAGTPTCWRPSPPAGSRSPSGRRSPPRRSCTPRRTTSPWRPGWAACSPTPRDGRPASRPGSARPGTRRRCCATARTRTSRRRSTVSGFGARGLAQAEQLHGKEMSYNNYVDADAARRAAYDFDEPAVAIIKHANPCGIAVGADVAEAHRRAHECDPVSAFGGVIATNVPVSVAMAEQVAEVFTEVVVAPGVRRGRGRGPGGEEEHPAAGVRAGPPRRRRDPADHRRAADAAPRRGRRRRATTRRPGRSRPARPPRPRCSPTWRSPGGPAGP